MEVLHFMLERATHEGQLPPLADTSLRQCTSIYANDTVTFLKPRVDDLGTFVAIVDDLGLLRGYALTSASVRHI
jgi:hypothetical protein